MKFKICLIFKSNAWKCSNIFEYSYNIISLTVIDFSRINKCMILVYNLMDFRIKVHCRIVQWKDN